MELILVRHGLAGRKVEWHRPDEQRPLNSRGLRQAERLIAVIAPMEPSRIISSPYVRCLQTAEPLAARVGLKVEQSTALVPDAPVKALRFVRELTSPKAESGVVIVTHGEIMGVVLSTMAKEDGVKLEHRPPGLKGCAWSLDCVGGKLVAARYIPPT